MLWRGEIVVRARSLPVKALVALPVIVVVLCLAVTAISFLPNTILAGWLVTDYLDRKGLPCEQLPAADHVQRVLDEHRAVWRQVQEHSDWVEVDIRRCPGKADLAIYYPTNRDRARIRQLIGDTFFGIPYRMFLV